MNAIDFIIIYLACGAPFSVYYYLQHRLRKEKKFIWLKTILAFIFWIPYALFIFSKIHITNNLFNPDFNRLYSDDLIIEKKLLAVQKKIENIISDSSLNIPLFEFRQTIERYTGLTLLLQNNKEEIYEQEKEIFRLDKSNNVAIAAVCLQRRNRKLLGFHQSKARQDFLKMVENLSVSISAKKNLENLTIEVVNLLKDCAAQNGLEKLFAANLQTDNPLSVRQSEEVLWKTEIPKPLITSPISARLQVTTPMSNLRSED